MQFYKRFHEHSEMNIQHRDNDITKTGKKIEHIKIEKMKISKLESIHIVVLELWY